MPPTFPDDSAFDEEVGLRTDVRIAIDLALDDVLEDSERREATDVEEQKLTHFAIRDLDLPLTYSWYLAGGHSIAQVDTTNQPTWSPGQSFGELNSQRVQDDENINKLRTYFRSAEFFPGYRLRDVWFTDKFEFLHDYYAALAPEKYRELYLHSLAIREKLWNLSDVVGKGSQNAALSDFGTGNPMAVLDASVEREFRYHVSDFHMDIASIEELAPFKADVVRATDAIEMVLSKLTQLDSTTVEQQLLLQRDIHDYFYYYVWKYPALAMAADTATGPNAEALRRKRLLEFNGFEEKLSAEVSSFNRQARGVGLVPSIDEHGSRDSEKTGYLHSLLRETIDSR